MDKHQEELLRRARKFDQQALAEIYDSYSTGLYGYALRLLGDTNIAEECVAEAFTRFLNALHSGKGPKDHLKAYLYRIAHNWITDYYRRHPPESLPLEEDFNIPDETRLEELVANRIQRDQLREALFRLTPDQRQVIMLVFIEGWRKAEVAAVLGKPVGAIKSLQYRALNSLRRILGITNNEAKHEEVRPYARFTS
jgi:RNA polymerase sigma-70 factor (ECF subfamily)